jgi:hypothetical protein
MRYDSWMATSSDGKKLEFAYKELSEGFAAVSSEQGQSSTTTAARLLKKLDAHGEPTFECSSCAAPAYGSAKKDKLGDLTQTMRCTKCHAVLGEWATIAEREDALSALQVSA